MEFTSWAAAALLGTAELDAAEILDEMAAAHLVDVLQRLGEPGVRYRMHDLLRLYAQERFIDEESPIAALAVVLRLAEAYLHPALRTEAALG